MFEVVAAVFLVASAVWTGFRFVSGRISPGEGVVCAILLVATGAAVILS